VQKLGVGVSAPPRERLTAEALAAALRRCARPEVKSRALSLASRMVLDGAKIAAQRLTNERE
jgi:hypothetical protein